MILGVRIMLPRAITLGAKNTYGGKNGGTTPLKLVKWKIAGGERVL